MARRGSYGDPTPGGTLGPLAAVVMLIIGLVVVVAIMSFTPTIGGQITNARGSPELQETCIWNFSGVGARTITGMCSANSSGLLVKASGWNATNVSTDIYGLEVTTYTDNVGMVTLLITIVIIAIALGYLIGI